jgi:hypothetical protein
MKIAAIKALTEKHELADLKKAEEALLNEQKPVIHIEGEDEGEQLTHVMAAIWIKEYMAQHNADLKTALRAYTDRVRSSIS